MVKVKVKLAPATIYIISECSQPGHQRICFCQLMGILSKLDTETPPTGHIFYLNVAVVAAFKHRQILHTCLRNEVLVNYVMIAKPTLIT